ncbi:MAG: TldD/PmbA family protein [Chloroflexi bacterium]|nr:TldD/PmbA family protein [Chloroflexota bacterium]
MTKSSEGITIEVIPQIKDLVQDVVTSYIRRLPGIQYADIRVEVGEGQGAFAENGNEKHAGRDYSFAFGIRVLAGNNVVAPGYYGQLIGESDRANLARILRKGVRHAHRRALANAERKAQAKGNFVSLGESLYSTRLASIGVHQDVVPAEYEIDPRTVPLQDIASHAREASKALMGLDGQVRFNATGIFTMVTRELFCSSEGANIEQSFALTQGMSYVVAQGEKGSQELVDFVGHQRGWEVISKGINEPYIKAPSFLDFSLNLGRDAIALANAEPLKTTEKEVVVVTDPHFNTLLVHEIVGHPTELDRALKMETAYAGRTWLFKDMGNNQLGEQIASPLVDAFSDPSLPGYGHYKYDDEGTPAKRVVHIEKGVFKGFMNSRQTAAILGVDPNGSLKASEVYLVPLIRMSNTVFGSGERDPSEIIGEVEHGYYLVGHRIPSISESRENFRASSMKVYEIRNGEIGRLFRNGGIMADSKSFLMAVDAVGNDFTLYPIPNCGKGQPMQVKRLGNGGPTMRSRARLAGV